MKKTLAWAFAALMALTVPAQAGIGAFASWWDSKDYGDMYGGGGRIAIGLPLGLWVEGRVSWLESRDYEAADVALLPMEAIAGLQIGSGDILQPYIGAGVGYYLKEFDWHAKWKHWEEQFDEKDCVGYFALAGLDISLGSLKIFGEAKYTLVGKDDKLEWRGEDVKQKYSFDGLSANAGVKIGF